MTTESQKAFDDLCNELCDLEVSNEVLEAHDGGYELGVNHERNRIRAMLESEEIRQTIQERCIITGINGESISYKIDAKAALKAVVDRLKIKS